MNKTTQRFEALLKREWHKKFRRYSIYLAIFILLVMSSIAYSTGPIKFVELPVIGMFSMASEEVGERFYIIVELEDQTTKRLMIPRATAVKVGDKVSVIERSTHFFGIKKYTFQKML